MFKDFLLKDYGEIMKKLIFLFLLMLPLVVKPASEKPNPDELGVEMWYYVKDAMSRAKSESVKPSEKDCLDGDLSEEGCLSGGIFPCPCQRALDKAMFPTREYFSKCMSELYLQMRDRLYPFGIIQHLKFNPFMSLRDNLASFSVGPDGDPLEVDALVEEYADVSPYDFSWDCGDEESRRRILMPFENLSRALLLEHQRGDNGRKKYLLEIMNRKYPFLYRRIAFGGGIKVLERVVGMNDYFAHRLLLGER